MRVRIDTMPAVETVDLLERALRQMRGVITSIRPDQADLPTPCAAWDVRALIQHVIGQDLPNFIVAAGGGTPDWGAPPSTLSDDWGAQFDAAARDLLAAWRRADADTLVAAPGGAQVPLGSRASQQIAELAIHSWDLAKATQQSTDLDPELAEAALAWSRPMLRPEYRGADKAFGAEVPVPENAPVYDRMAGWFGRDPNWSPGRSG